MKLTFVVQSVALEFDKKLLRRILRQAGNEIRDTARSLIGRDQSGRKYGSHTASGAGNPPGIVSGLLARSLKVSARGDRVTISDPAEKKDAFYAVMLEAGAIGGGGRKGSKNVGRSHKRGGSKGKPVTKRILQPRPFLSIAAQEEMPGLEKRINQALQKSVDLKILKKSS
jgi:hypothetical protein